ncbi:MAG TPA: lipopolysaccharide biosynthesis protein [Pirellulales bacterium]|jgi:PST family polysaccharide transporter
MEPESPEPATPDTTAGGAFATSFSTEGLRAAVRSGSRRTLWAQGASHVISLVVLASLMRLIGPQNFGLFAMVVPLMLLLRLGSAMGMNIATVQLPDLTSEQVSSAFWLHVLLGLAMGVVTLAVAPIVAWFNHTPELFLVTVALVGTPLASAVGLQHCSLLERNLRLGSAAVARLGAQFLGGVAAVYVAWHGGGVWALVVQQYVELLVTAAIAWYLEPWRPQRPARGAPIGHVLRFGGYFTASAVVLLLLTSVDKLLVGRVLGAAALGFYSQAFSLMNKPIVILTAPLSTIMLPALARSAHERGNYIQIVLAFERLVAVLSFPAGIGLMVVAQDTMLAFGGSEWAEAGPLLAALSPTILTLTFIMTASSVFASAGQWRAMFLGSVLMAVVLVQGLFVGLYVGGQYGGATLGVAWAYSLTTCMAIFVPYMVFCMRAIGVSPLAWARQLVRPAMAAIGMGVIVFVAREKLLGVTSLGPAARLVIAMSIGVVAYGALAWRELRWCAAQLRGI